MQFSTLLSTVIFAAVVKGSALPAGISCFFVVFVVGAGLRSERLENGGEGANELIE